ncbi:MAG: ABC transporter ATP-binding protein [Chloroflexi bacterium]|nr:ABC transporter ATP-binding protein [Chloroflexota bacterium]
MDVLLRAEKLTKHYGPVVALESATFDVTDGVTGLLGSNGAGKSTAIKLFLGLIKPTSGSMQVLGVETAHNVDVRARLGYMPEHDCLPNNVAATEFLTHMAQVSGLPPAQARSRAADTLRHVGLFEERYRPIGGYSTGMKQRVKLAQALVHDPALILLDEPTAGLDPGGREEMLDLVRKTHSEFGISLMLSSHLMGDVERTCDRIIVLEEGQVVQQGAVTGFTSEMETLFIEVEDRRDEFISTLQRLNVNATADDGGVMIIGAVEDTYDLISRALVESEAPLRRMGPRRHALTELFTGAPTAGGAG